jgi:hypothetical protein
LLEILIRRELFVAIVVVPLRGRGKDAVKVSTRESPQHRAEDGIWLTAEAAGSCVFRASGYTPPVSAYGVVADTIDEVVVDSFLQDSHNNIVELFKTCL